MALQEGRLTMSNMEMLGRIVRRLGMLLDVRPGEILGPIEDLLSKLQADFDAWIAELKKFLRKEPCWVSTLPFRKEEESFLRVARIILFDPRVAWNVHSLTVEMQRQNEFFNTEIASRYFTILDELKVTRSESREPGWHRVLMSSKKFEATFNVKFPQ
jgi:hypothetical protein